MNNSAPVVTTCKMTLRRITRKSWKKSMRQLIGQPKRNCGSFIFSITTCLREPERSSPALMARSWCRRCLHIMRARAVLSCPCKRSCRRNRYRGALHPHRLVLLGGCRLGGGGFDHSRRGWEKGGRKQDDNYRMEEMK